MATRACILRVLQLLDGAYPRGGYALQGQVKANVIMAWLELLGGDDFRDSDVEHHARSLLQTNDYPVKPGEVLRSVRGSARVAGSDNRLADCSDCNDGWVPFLWHHVERGNAAEGTTDHHKVKSCVAACVRCQAGRARENGPADGRLNAEALCAALDSGRVSGQVLAWHVGVGIPVTAEREIGRTVRQCNAESQRRAKLGSEEPMPGLDSPPAQLV
jgi:hypothetical protein